jgi:hypothetical protein
MRPFPTFLRSLAGRMRAQLLGSPSIDKQLVLMHAANQSPASLTVQKREPNNMVLHLEGLTDASLDRRCEPGLPGKTTNQPLSNNT